MDTNPSISLSFLYRSDPFYSVCAADLMTAPQTVNNNFVKEQRQLIKALRTLERQRQIRMRQLSEERRTFAFVMNKKLGPRGARPHTAPLYSSSSILPSIRGPLSAPAALSNRTTLGSKRGGSAKEGQVINVQVTGVTSRTSSSKLVVIQKENARDTQDKNVRKVGQDKGSSAGQTCCECEHPRQLLARGHSCPSILQRHPS